MLLPAPCCACATPIVCCKNLSRNVRVVGKTGPKIECMVTRLQYRDSRRSRVCARYYFEYCGKTGPKIEWIVTRPQYRDSRSSRVCAGYYFEYFNLRLLSVDVDVLASTRRFSNPVTPALFRTPIPGTLVPGMGVFNAYNQFV